MAPPVCPSEPLADVKKGTFNMTSWLEVSSENFAFSPFFFPIPSVFMNFFLFSYSLSNDLLHSLTLALLFQIPEAPNAKIRSVQVYSPSYVVDSSRWGFKLSQLLLLLF